MKCTYTLKGHVFNSEMELNDFLLDSYEDYKLFGDAVFKKSEAHNHVNRKIHRARLLSNDLQNKKIVTKRIGLDGELYEDAIRPYEGVTEFLDKFTLPDNSPLFPIFIPDNYWEKEFAKWKSGDFTDKFGVLDEDLVLLLGVTPGVPITDEKLLEKYRKKVEVKWDFQGKAGTEIHKVLQCYFTTNKGEEAGDMRINGSAGRAYVRGLLNKKGGKFELKKEFINDLHVEDLLNICERVREQCEKEFGKNLNFFPEMTISGALNDGSGKSVLGMIDLLVTDEKGNVHIIDFKTSPKQYIDYGKPKKRTFLYQVAVYNRLLRMLGIDTKESTVKILPIQLDGLKEDPNKEGKFIYDHLRVEAETGSVWHDVTDEIKQPDIQDNIDEFLPYEDFTELTTQEISQHVDSYMRERFPEFGKTRNRTDEEIKEMIEPYTEFNEDTKRWEYQRGKLEPLIAQTLPELIKKYKKEQDKYKRNRDFVYETTLNALKEGIKTKSGRVDLNFKHINLNVNSNSEWFLTRFSKYCDGRWRTIEHDAFKQFGMIVLLNYDTRQIDIVKLSTSDPAYMSKKSKLHNLMAGVGVSDIEEQSNKKSLALLGTDGNIEMMQVMAVLNYTTVFSGNECNIGNISVTNPHLGSGIAATNEELLYNWSKINKRKPLQNDRYLSSSKNQIKLMDTYELAYRELQSATEWAKTENFEKKMEAEDWNGFVGYVSQLEETITNEFDVDIKLQKLDEIRKKMEDISRWRDLLNVPSREQAIQNRRYVRAYNAVLMAIGGLKGINFRQQLQDHDKFYGKLAAGGLFTGELSGTYIDNPGNMSSETLNTITNLVTEAYQNVRDDMSRVTSDLRTLTSKLKEAKGFGFISENTVGNMTDIFSNLTEVKAGDLMFVNPWDESNNLIPEERDYLKYVINLVNRNKLSTQGKVASDQELKIARKRNPQSFFKCPLMIGNSLSKASTRGWLEGLKDKLRSLHPKAAWDRARKQILGIEIDDQIEDSNYKSDLTFEMTNMFSVGDGSDRYKVLNKHPLESEEDKGQFETNLETLALAHTYAYSQLKNINSVFPTIKAAYIHLIEQGNNKNIPFDKDLLYITEYIKAKVLGQSIIDPKNKEFAKYVNSVKQAASIMALAVSPVQSIYQTIQGLWMDIKLFLTQPDGQQSFTFENLRRGFTEAFKDIVHYDISKPTRCQLFNEMYGLNDMDMNVHKFVENIKSDRHGIFNLNRFLFKFASRPDYYNRLTIWNAQMCKDGTFDAHSVKNGRLVYDMKKDKRFEILLSGDKNNPEYYTQKALYMEMCKLFIREGAKNPDGTPFKMPSESEMNRGEFKSLPRAYTNQLAESMKSIADTIYGYYSHEKKSLMHNTLAGGLFMQMRTYWSGKKNQYLARGGVKLQGHYELLKDLNGNLLYYAVDEKTGKVSEDEFTTEANHHPVVQWKGLFQEGVCSSMARLWNMAVGSKGNLSDFKLSWDELMNSKDPAVRDAVRYNFKSSLYDIVMFWFIGSIVAAMLTDWLKELKDNSVSDSIADGIKLSAANIAVKSVQNSFMDFNMIKSIGEPLVSWDPFAFSYALRTAKRVAGVAMGDNNFYDTVVKSFVATNTVKPFFDAIKPDIFKSE